MINAVLPNEILCELKTPLSKAPRYSLRQRDLCCCVCSQWNVLVCFNKYLSIKRDQLDVYDTISFSKAIKPKKVSPIYDGICMGPQGNTVMLSDIENYTIWVVDLEGNRILAFGSKGNGLYEFEDPRGICVSESRILVADSGNKRIQVFDTQYSFLSSISTGQF